MNNLENLTLKTLEQLNKLNDEQILKIIEIKKINEKSLLAILLEENMLEEEIFFEILSDIYRRGHTDIDEISTSLQIDQKRFIQYVCDKFKITFFALLFIKDLRFFIKILKNNIKFCTILT